MQLARKPAGLHGYAKRVAARLVVRSASFKIVYTHTDEAPALATYAFLPVIQKMTKWADVQVRSEHTRGGLTPPICGLPRQCWKKISSFR